jgi:hypothetical protein
LALVQGASGSLSPTLKKIFPLMLLASGAVCSFSGDLGGFCTMISGSMGFSGLFLLILGGMLVLVKNFLDQFSPDFCQVFAGFSS